MMIFVPINSSFDESAVSCSSDHYSQCSRENLARSGGSAGTGASTKAKGGVTIAPSLSLHMPGGAGEKQDPR